MIPIAFDFETYRFSEGNLAPKPICISSCYRDQDGKLQSTLFGNHPEDGMRAYVEHLLTNDRFLLIGQGCAYDLAVICNEWPEFIPLVFEVILKGRIIDTKWREKLLNLSTTGRLEKMEMPDGTKVKIQYGLEQLAEKYLQLDLSADKNNLDTAWRANYSALDGWKAIDYPDDASRYAIEDSEHTLQVYEQQDIALQQDPNASMMTQEFQLVKAFVLYLMSCWGIAVDPEATDRRS